jgi:hypothetical protein
VAGSIVGVAYSIYLFQTNGVLRNVLNFRFLIICGVVCSLRRISFQPKKRVCERALIQKRNKQIGLFLRAHDVSQIVMTIANAKNARKSLIFAEYLPSINFCNKTLNQAPVSFR